MAIQFKVLAMGFENTFCKFHLLSVALNYDHKFAFIQALLLPGGTAKFNTNRS
jgi:hypothetical protein